MAELGSIEDQERKRLLFGDDRMPTKEEDLSQYLRGEFQQGEPLRITSNTGTSVGLQLADREVSRLEVLNAMRRLPLRQRRIVELLYIDGRSCSNTAERLNISERTLYRERAASLRIMADVIYDWR